MSAKYVLLLNEHGLPRGLLVNGMPIGDRATLVEMTAEPGRIAKLVVTLQLLPDELDIRLAESGDDNRRAELPTRLADVDLASWSVNGEQAVMLVAPGWFTGAVPASDCVRALAPELALRMPEAFASLEQAEAHIAQLHSRNATRKRNDSGQAYPWEI